jgi:hypothetical protein
MSAQIDYRPTPPSEAGDDEIDRRIGILANGAKIGKLLLELSANFEEAITYAE